MKKNKICIYLFTIALLGSIFFSACKKYPENKGIHLALAKNRIVNSGDYVITIYTVNGEDSLGLLSNKWGQDISTVKWSIYPEDNRYFHLEDFPFSKTQNGSFEFKDNNKKMGVLYNLEYYLAGYNMFLTVNSEWDILKLYKKKNKTTLKLKRIYNGKTYIIQFNN